MIERLRTLASRPSTLVYGIGFWLALIQISIAASQIVLTVVLALWLFHLATGKLDFIRLPIDGALGAFVTLSLLSALFSFDPWISLVDVKKLALFAVPYLTVSVIRRESMFEALILLVIGIADLTALLSLWHYFFGELGDINHRLQGFMSHYMTFSGLLMSVGILAFALLIFQGKRRVFLSGSLLLILSVLALGLTRSTWLGFFVAAALLIFLKDFRLLAAVPVLGLGAWLLIPPEIEARLRTFTRPDISGTDRYYMLLSGAKMCENHPLFGVGPDMISVVYPIYVAEGAPNRQNVHLHNNMAQIAAERGIPCLIAWVWLIISIIYWASRAYRQSRGNGARQALAGGALGVTVATFTAGLFEYNFGDSEFLMLFLFIAAIPFVLEKSRVDAGAD
jgi:O-antigen ligase